MSTRAARRRDLRLIPVAALAWAAAAVASLVPGASWTLVVSSAIGAVVSLAAARATGGLLRTACAVAAVALACVGAVGAQVAVAQPSRAAALGLEFGGGRALTIDVTVVGKVDERGNGLGAARAAQWRFDAIATRIAYGDEDHALSVPVEVHIGERAQGTDVGARLRLSGTAWAAVTGERAVLVVRAVGAPQLLVPPTGVFALASGLRAGLRDAVAGLPQPAAGLIAGLAVGDTDGVTDELDGQMKATSLSHLTAVSGANCALVVGIAVGLAAWAGARRGARVVIGLSALVGFVVLVTPEPSVVRAAAMSAIAMGGLLLGRIGAGVSVLSLAVTALLIVDPWLAGSIGFALSTAATAALLLLAGPLASGLARWMPHPLALAVSVPLAAQLACGPILILIAPAVPVYGVVANLLAGPAAPVGTVLGLLCCLAGIVPLLAQGLAVLAWLPAAWIAETAQVAASLPAPALPWLDGWPGLAALAIVGGAVAIVVIVPAAATSIATSAVTSAARPHDARTRLRIGATLLLAVAGGIVLATGPLLATLDRMRVPSEWALVACDIGQGDALLLRSSGHVAAIDAGPDPAALAACLDRFGVDRVELLVLTHFDLDHRGGVDALVGRVGTVLHGPLGESPAEIAENEAILTTLRDHGAATIEARAGMTGELGRSAWRVRWPGPHAQAGNDASIVIDIGGDGIPHTLFLGDLSAAPQAALAAHGARGPYDVVKVAHHGSADQDPRLYAALGARVAVVSVGANTFGHPRAETLDLVAELGMMILRTDCDGPVALWTDADGLHVWRDRRDVCSPR